MVLIGFFLMAEDKMASRLGPCFLSLGVALIVIGIAAAIVPIG